MMNQKEAIAYGRRTGCKYYVYNEMGGLLGGFRTRESAEDCRRRFEKEYESNPWCKGVRVFVKEVA